MSSSIINYVAFRSLFWYSTVAAKEAREKPERTQGGEASSRKGLLSDLAPAAENLPAINSDDIRSGKVKINCDGSVLMEGEAKGEYTGLMDGCGSCAQRVVDAVTGEQIGYFNQTASYFGNIYSTQFDLLLKAQADGSGGYLYSINGWPDGIYAEEKNITFSEAFKKGYLPKEVLANPCLSGFFAEYKNDPEAAIMMIFDNSGKPLAFLGESAEFVVNEDLEHIYQFNLSEKELIDLTLRLRNECGAE